jgi:hypothetical protein
MQSRLTEIIWESGNTPQNAPCFKSPSFTLHAQPHSPPSTTPPPSQAQAQPQTHYNYSTPIKPLKPQESKNSQPNTHFSLNSFTTPTEHTNSLHLSALCSTNPSSTGMKKQQLHIGKSPLGKINSFCSKSLYSNPLLSNNTLSPVSLLMQDTQSSAYVYGDKLNRPCCNCKKSHCLKLYCDCFAQGLVCSGCNCFQCKNLLANSQQRILAMKATIDKNSNAFRPKIDYHDGEVRKFGFGFFKGFFRNGSYICEDVSAENQIA